MNATTIAVTDRQQEVLRQIHTAARDLARAARSLSGVADRTVERLDAGLRVSGQFSHQTPRDYWDAEARLDALLGVVAAAFDQWSPQIAEVVQAIVAGHDDMAIVYRLTDVEDDGR